MDPKQAKNFGSETKPGFFSDLGGYKQISRNLRLRREILVFKQKGILMGISRNSLQSRSFVKNLEFKDILDLP